MSPLDRQPTNNLTSPLVDLWGWGHKAECTLGVAGVRGAGISSMGAMPLMLAQMMGQQKNQTNKQTKKYTGPTYQTKRFSRKKIARIKYLKYQYMATEL